jgi:hypothetical protein
MAPDRRFSCSGAPTARARAADLPVALIVRESPFGVKHDPASWAGGLSKAVAVPGRVQHSPVKQCGPMSAVPFRNNSICGAALATAAT